ncbi:MAG: hypothetical protein GY928_02245 [Colwellia sp.]|nr:hypothetical protein [Colwellia sp.]
METLKEIQINLKKDIPYKWRVQSFNKNKPQATCVAYIDSRDVQDVLDSHCLWSDRYYEENDMLFCEITIYADGREYKRSDTGSESIADAKKGHSSDAFKRAAVKFGVGRFLYKLPIKYLTANEKKTNNNYPFVIDSNCKKVWDITKHINNSLHQPKQVSKPMDFDRLKARLEGCDTIEKLSTLYNSLSQKEKTISVAVKDAMKLKLTPKTE